MARLGINVPDLSNYGFSLLRILAQSADRSAPPAARASLAKM
jgi:hypothetical protein